MAELECKLCIALNCRGVYPTYENSSFFNLILDYLDQFYDKADVIADITPYIKLFQYEDAIAMREKIRAKIEALEASLAIQQHGASNHDKIS
jgi:hypothetical protein